jgi:Wax ester synthase-like Acyl-CoA acyltransferase domain
VDAPAFDLADHVRILPLPAPGDEAALLRAAEQLRRLRLDRSRPLWQMWFLPGLAEGRVGMFVKIHHVIGDASAGLAALAVLLDAAPGTPAGPARPWTPAPPPAARGLLADNLRRHATGLGHAASALARPVTTTRHARAAWTATRETAGPPRGPDQPGPPGRPRPHPRPPPQRPEPGPADRAQPPCDHQRRPAGRHRWRPARAAAQPGRTRRGSRRADLRTHHAAPGIAA